ncbi:MAG: DUF1553 domain-containing protein [Acidobacteria bacterium]|nr:DUF1553 domain-containing protein [Acidobacteriota bacterium]
MASAFLFLLAFAAPPDFDREIRPLLARRCLACHGPTMQKSHLRLDQRASVLKGGESGVPAVEPGRSAASLLVRYVEGTDPKFVMPPQGPRLTAVEVDLLKRWIDAGAPYPANADASPAAPDPRRAHWAFQSVRQPAVPGVKDKSWVRTPIDAFVLAKLEARGWRPNPPAAPAQLQRRMYFDITGLPPSLPEQRAFRGDLDAEAARLLASPAYGERWARHWLDLVRYADTNAYERDALKPQVWKYRDWVIRALNEDKPFDRFAIEQLAGDELPDSDAGTLLATGYHRLGPWDDEPANPEEDRFDQLDDIISTTSQAFLGLTLGCARCHNHKFEPLLTRDYYSMLAVFNGLERPRKDRTELDSPIGPRAVVGRAAAMETRIDTLRAGFRLQWLRGSESKLPAAAREAFLTPGNMRTEEQRKLVKDNQKTLDAELKAAPVETEIAAIRDELEQTPRGYFMVERSAVPPKTHILIRGKAGALGPGVEPAAPEIVAAKPLRPEAGSTSGRRLAFAKWMTSRENPLTARVIVNRVWQWHFGEGLVRTPSDFGVMGDKPEHPELLDWLAAWFMDNGWSLKKLHTLILSSNTYRMAKTSNAEYAAADPENRLWWRFPYRRLEAEALLDSTLAVSGQLNRELYGPQVWPAIQKEALEGSSDPGKIWQPFDEKKASRRAIYYIVKRSLMVPLMEALDFCDTARTSARRLNTAVAPQALQLFNGGFVNRQASHFAARIRSEAGADPAAQVRHAWQLALAREPNAAETGKMLAFLRGSSLEELARVVLNLNEFAYTN